jgi:hypothetical protein
MELSSPVAMVPVVSLMGWQAALDRHQCFLCRPWRCCTLRQWCRPVCARCTRCKCCRPEEKGSMYAPVPLESELASANAFLSLPH